MHFYVRLASITLICVVAILVLAQISFRVLGFVHIFGTHSGIVLTQEEVLDAHNKTVDERPQVVPKIIHQIFHNWHNPGNNTLPSDWDAVRESCTNVTQGWEYRLWTEKDSREFIEDEFPWFLSNYDGYALPVQRIDSLRYFLMRHYGGIYIDLDNGCTEDLTPLLYFPTWVTDGGHGALSNNILGAQPNHPFWNLLTDSLPDYDWKYPFPYVTVSYASGQWFETAMWEQYHHRLSQKGTEALERGQLHRIMMDMRPDSAKWVFFSQARGGTWDRWDNHLFGWIGSHVPQVALYAGIFVTLLLGGCIWWRARRNRGYSLLTNQSRDEDVAAA